MQIVSKMKHFDLDKMRFTTFYEFLWGVLDLLRITHYSFLNKPVSYLFRINRIVR